MPAGAGDGRLLAPLSLRRRPGNAPADLKRADKSGSKIQVLLHARDGSKMPVQISIRPLAKNGFNRATVAMVVTDMVEARRNEEMLRALTNRVVQAQEAERGRVALELHDNITQLLCAIVARGQPWRTSSGGRQASRGEAMKLSEMLGQTAEEVQRIARNLRPSILDELGLVPPCAPPARSLPVGRACPSKWPASR